MRLHLLEARKLAALAGPMIVGQVGMMMLGVVDILMVGRLGAEQLAAASLGHVWVAGTLVVARGLVMGIDPLVSQAHGAGDAKQLGLALQQGIVVALLATVPVVLLWTATGIVLIWTGQQPHLAWAAHQYVLVQLPAIPASPVFWTLRQYLAGRGIVYPTVWVILLANLSNAFLNWVLIFGHLGVPAQGLNGAGMATSITRWLTMAALALWIWGLRLHRGAWRPWSWAAVNPRGLGRILAVGGPVSVQFGLEVWAFSIATLLAGRLGETELAGHTIVLNMASLSFMMPLGISFAAATRVGNLIGAGKPLAAQRAAWVAMAMGAGVMAAAAVVFVVLRFWLPTMYTHEAAVGAQCALILPIAAAFQLFDGTQVVGTGVLRGMGRTRAPAAINLVGYYGLALPFASWMSSHGSAGLAGIWWSLCLGLGVVAALLTGWVWRRGPASLQANPLR